MEARIEKLEEFAVEVRGELRSIDVRLTKIEVILPTLATKADLISLKDDVELVRVSNKADIESLKVLIHKTASDTQKWMVATIIGMCLGFGAIVIGMSNTLKPNIQVMPAVVAPQALPQR